MDRWHRCSRWTEVKLPCPYSGLTTEKGDEDQAAEKEPEPARNPVPGDTTQGQAADKVRLGAQRGIKDTERQAAAAANVDVHKLIEDDISIKERDLEVPGPGAVPLWEDDFPREISRTWQTPSEAHGLADLIFADPAGPDTISTLPLVGIRQSATKTFNTVSDPLLPPAPRSTAGPGGPGGSYPLIENRIAMAMAGKTSPVPKVMAISREPSKNPRSVEQDAWDIQTPLALVAGSVALAAMQATVLHPGHIAAHMEAVITKTVKDSVVRAVPRDAQGRIITKIKVSTGTAGGKGKGGMKGGAFQTRTIWEPELLGGKRSVVDDWRQELKRVTGDGNGFQGILG